MDRREITPTNVSPVYLGRFTPQFSFVLLLKDITAFPLNHTFSGKTKGLFENTEKGPPESLSRDSTVGCDNIVNSMD